MLNSLSSAAEKKLSSPWRFILPTLPPEWGRKSGKCNTTERSGLINLKMSQIKNTSAKEKVIRAAISVFSEKGYSASSVREIVAKAGVTKPVLYYYFKNKEGLFKAILNLAAEMQEELLKEALQKDGTVLEKLYYLFDLVYEGIKQFPEMFSLIHNLIFGPPQGAPDYDLWRYHRSVLEAIKKIYSDGISSNQMIEADPDEVALVILSVLDFSLHLDHISPESPDPEKPKKLLYLALRGILIGEHHE